MQARTAPDMYMYQSGQGQKPGLKPVSHLNIFDVAAGELS